MFRLLIIDDAECKNELDAFLTKHKKSVLSAIATTHLNYNLNKKITFKTSSGLRILNINDIMYCEIKNKNSYKVFTLNGACFNALDSFKLVEEILIEHFFVHIHQSFFINIYHLDTYTKKPSQALLSNGIILPVSARKKDFLLKQLQQFKF